MRRIGKVTILIQAPNHRRPTGVAWDADAKREEAARRREHSLMFGVSARNRDWFDKMDGAASLVEPTRTMRLDATVVVQLRIAGQLA